MSAMRAALSLRELGARLPLTMLRVFPGDASAAMDAAAVAGRASWSGGVWNRIVSLLPDLTDLPALLAVPKRKVTPSRKGMRSANKHIRFIPIVSQCSACGRVFPSQHVMPSKCEEDDCPAFNLRERPMHTRESTGGEHGGEEGEEEGDGSGSGGSGGGRAGAEK